MIVGSDSEATGPEATSNKKLGYQFRLLISKVRNNVNKFIRKEIITMKRTTSIV